MHTYKQLKTTRSTSCYAASAFHTSQSHFTPNKRFHEFQVRAPRDSSPWIQIINMSPSHHPDNNKNRQQWIMHFPGNTGPKIGVPDSDFVTGPQIHHFGVTPIIILHLLSPLRCVDWTPCAPALGCPKLCPFFSVTKSSVCPSRQRRIRIPFQRVAICLKMGHKVELGALNTNMATVLTQVKWFDQ